MYNERDRTWSNSRVSMRSMPSTDKPRKLHKKGKKTEDDGIITPCSSQTSERKWRSKSGKGEEKRVLYSRGR